MITLNVIVSNTTTIKVITEGEGAENRPKNNYVICVRSLTDDYMKIFY